MTQKAKEHKKQYKVSGRPIINVLVGLGFLTVILLITMMSATKDSRYHGGANAGKSLQDNQSIQEQGADGNVLAVVKSIDTELKIITLYDVNQHQQLELNYTGGTNVTDKYDKIISISQIEAGAMVDIAYLEDKMKLTDMSISKKAWEYVGVNNFTIDLLAKMMKIATTKYKYGDDVLVLNGEEYVPITTLTEQDELTVRGNEEQICSITVTRGHGTVVLEDYEDFLGANITIGYEAMQQITEDTQITVREGNFNLNVDTGEYSATKNITVYRNQTTMVSLNDIGPAAMKKSMIGFNITPFGADLYIDSELTSYAEPIELSYGEYHIKVSMGGYTTYDGTLAVNSAGKTIKIDLPESSSEEEVTVTETQNSGVTGNDDSGTDKSETDNIVSDNTDTESGSTDTDKAPEDTSSDATGDIDKEHVIYVQKPAGASVYIDGKFKCIAPDSFQKMIGTHVITFIQEGYQTKSYTIEISDDSLDTYLTFPDLVKE